MADPKHVARAVDVAYFELGDFRDPKSGTVQDCQHGALTKIAWCFQQRFHFRAAQDQRQLSFSSRKRDALDRDFSAKSVGIEKPERTDDLDVSGLRHSFLFEEEQLIAANVLGFELIGWFGEVPSELGDDTQVNPDGSR